MRKIVTLSMLFCGTLGGLLAQEKMSTTENDDVNQKSKIQSTLEDLFWSDRNLNIMLDTRVDYDSKFDHDETDASGFNGQTIKFLMFGEIVPGVRYRLRQRLNRVQTPSRDNYGSATDMAYVQFDAGDKWSFTVGKQVALFGTFEIDYNPADVYLSTMVNNDIDAYKTGVAAAYTAFGQTFHFQAINSDSPQFAADKYKNKAFAGLFLWDGSLFGGLFKTKYGYAALQHDASQYYSWVTLGNQLNVRNFTAELDFYGGNRNVDYSSEFGEGEFNDLGVRYVRDRSVSLNLKYNLGKFRPALKGVWNERKDLVNNGSYISGGIQGLVEYYPFTDPKLKDLRFHVAYIYTRTNFNGVYNNIDGINKNEILAGMRWLFKIK